MLDILPIPTIFMYVYYIFYIFDIFHEIILSQIYEKILNVHDI